jgi:hypothetical protein
MANKGFADITATLGFISSVDAAGAEKEKEPVFSTENVKNEETVIPKKKPVTSEATQPPRELKTKRFNVVLPPSLHDDMRKIATVKRISLNEAVCRALAEYRTRESRALDKFEILMED